ncbi:MAG: WavE lipopolysaccharide synthesis family protein [bacterium]|nr:WavE lipopolysaccharide synthesis family protein [bacterium]
MNPEELTQKLNIFLKYLLSLIERKRGNFITLHERPMYIKNLRLLPPESNTKLPKTAVVIQGPILKTHDFTLETVRLYKRNFVKSSIIVSTWKDEDPDYLEKIKGVGGIVVVSEKPLNPGLRNANMQIVTTSAGMGKAQELGATYALKTRTDQRMYGRQVMEFLTNLLDIFPISKSLKQKKRVVGFSWNTKLETLYNFSDTFQFGTIEDMLAYWPHDLIYERPGDKTTFATGEHMTTEAQLFTRFLKRVGAEFPASREEWQKTLATQAIVIDAFPLDLYFYKYDRSREYRDLSYEYRMRDVTFVEWFNLYIKYKNS